MTGHSGHAGPTAVILWMRDGTEREEVFASRFQAELYVAMIPFTVEPDGAHTVEAAILSPLVVAGAAASG